MYSSANRNAVIFVSVRAVVKSFKALFGWLVFMCRVGCECGGI